MTAHCIDCGRDAAAHPVAYQSGGTCATFKTMDLPAGETCDTCGHFRFCSQYIGPEIAGNTSCDWYPVRFVYPRPGSAEKKEKVVFGG